MPEMPMSFDQSGFDKVEIQIRNVLIPTREYLKTLKGKEKFVELLDLMIGELRSGNPLPQVKDMVDFMSLTAAAIFHFHVPVTA